MENHILIISAVGAEDAAASSRKKILDKIWTYGEINESLPALFLCGRFGFYPSPQCYKLEPG